MSGGHPFSADRNEVETGGLSDGVDYQHSESDRLLFGLIRYAKRVVK